MYSNNISIREDSLERGRRIEARCVSDDCTREERT